MAGLLKGGVKNRRGIERDKVGFGGGCWGNTYPCMTRDPVQKKKKH